MVRDEASFKMLGMQLRQELRLTQQLLMTPQLQLAIKLLQVNQLELVDIVQRELVENPVLEEGGDEPNRAGGGDSGDAAPSAEGDVPYGAAELEKLDSQERRESSQEKKTKDGAEIDWDAYLENRASQAPMPSQRFESSDLPGVEANSTSPDTLFEHLLWQIHMTGFVENEQRLAVLIVGNLDGEGYLSAEVTLAELAEEAGILLEDAEEVLKMVQQLDPVGVGARDLRECLLAQVANRGLDADVEAIVDRHLEDLGHRRYDVIARDLGVTLGDVYEVAKIISELEPSPGRNHTGQEARYITPDVFVYASEGKYHVVPNDDGMPKLKISGYYRSALGGDRATREYVKSKLRSAQWLIRSIDQRRRTIIRVTECIVERQQDFFDKGVAHLKPMILREVANDVGMHESTISRVTNGKYVHTARGIFELKYFFNPGIRSNTGPDVANESVKESIRHIVDGEDKRKPLSDQKIVELLAATGIVIARRTVAKYRDMLGVYSSSKRRKEF
jgi:RNA polymerase sigma-54 factor